MVGGAWFACSGAAELLVSGMESMRLLLGWPSLHAFVVWRARADSALLVATLTLAIVAIVGLLVLRASRAADGAPVPLRKSLHER